MRYKEKGCYLDEAFELVVLCQELRLFLLQGEDVVRRLLQDSRLLVVNQKEKWVRGYYVQNCQKMYHNRRHRFCTLLSFSPSVWGRSVFRDWKPALMLCMRRRSLLLAISRRIRLSWSWAVSGLRGMLARLRKKEQRGETVITLSSVTNEKVEAPIWYIFDNNSYPVLVQSFSLQTTSSAAKQEFDIMLK